MVIPRLKQRNVWRLAGEAPITVTRDAQGVPHVRAAGEADLYHGLGSCHGRDRALQLIVTRILAQGRASELLQPTDETLILDRFFRRMNFDGGTEQEASRLSPDHLRS